jgi:hypothetical protein
MAPGVPMSAQFWPCPACSRHIKKGDALCPFCDATARVEGGPTRVLTGRLSRAALFAAGTVGAAAASANCASWWAQPPYGAGPPPGAVEVFPNGTEDASASDAPSEVAADAADASATTMPTDSATADAGDESANEASSDDDVFLTVTHYGAISPPPDE